MSSQQNDEKFEEFLQREARAYNDPPENVPRDEMFASIVGARAGSRGAVDRRPKTENRVRSPRLTWIGMAAALAIGVAIGKFALDTRGSSRPATALGTVTPNLSRATGDTGSTLYGRAATVQLARAEALLTEYGTSRGNAGVDKQLSAWARDILLNTRLLLDSPAADDPARRRLLQDLELVLVQMVQRSPVAGAADERAQIDRSLDRTQVLSRLRTALPAGRNN